MIEPCPSTSKDSLNILDNVDTSYPPTQLRSLGDYAQILSDSLVPLWLCYYTYYPSDDSFIADRMVWDSFILVTAVLSMIRGSHATEQEDLSSPVGQYGV